jgi:hypothetical protein
VDILPMRSLFRHYPLTSVTRMLYPFILTRQPDGKALTFAFRNRFGLPLFAVQGPGIAYAHEYNRFAPTGPEQVYQIHDTIADGLHGVQAGQLILQKLLDTRYVSSPNGAAFQG